MTTTCEPTTGSTDASTSSTDDGPIVLSCRIVCLNPLDTGSEGEHWHHVVSLSAGKSYFQLGDEPLSYVTESVAPVGEKESWKVMSFI